MRDERMQEILKWKNALAIKNKNGLPFLLTGPIIWTIITILFLKPFELREKNIFALYSTGIMFPLSVLLSSLLKAEWRNKKIP
jgi:hypothetical protein